MLLDTLPTIMSVGVLFAALRLLKHALPDFRPIWAVNIVAAAILVLTQLQVVVPIGFEWAKNSQQTYNELYVGYEARARVEDTPCEKDGDCIHTFECEVREWTTTDEDGKETKHRTSHQCPYSDLEQTYYIDTTIKYTPDAKKQKAKFQTKTVAKGRFPTRYQRWRGSFDAASADDVRERAKDVGVGPPGAWLAADARIKAGDPGMIEMKFPYKSPILASDKTVQRQASARVKDFKSWGLIPSGPDYQLRDTGITNKVYFTGGFRPANPGLWHAEARRLAAAGGTRQGDIHILITQDRRLASQAQAFVEAWKAAWQGEDEEARDKLGRDAISKNALMVAIWTPDGKTVGWAAGITGMPKGDGNDDLLEQTKSLEGKSLEPSVILGHPKAQLIPKDGGLGAKVIPSQTAGSLEDMILFGPHAFVRRCMFCVGEKALGYDYLVDQIQPSGGQVFVILFVDLLLVCLYWALVLGLTHHFRSSRGSNASGLYTGDLPGRRRSTMRVRTLR
jgi:hypothetical protein